MGSEIQNENCRRDVVALAGMSTDMWGSYHTPAFVLESGIFSSLAANY